MCVAIRSKKALTRNQSKSINCCPFLRLAPHRSARIARCGAVYQIEVRELGYIYRSLNPCGVRDAGQTA
jgi:hypothetical protein